jgi:DNA polymerase-4
VPPLAPRICCLDLDTFFVSVERLLDPSLEGLPVVVGGRPGQRGVVTAASYEVRAFGVRSGMSMTDAVRLAPHAVFLPTRHGTYEPYAQQVREIAKRFSPVVRVASIDEMFLDFRGCERLYRQPGDPGPDETIFRVVQELTGAIRQEVGLPASAGVATGKDLAKVASGLAKPKGVLMVRAGAEARVLAPLPVRKFPGIGPVAEQKLASVGITTLGQLAAAPPPLVRRVFGSWAERVRRGAGGLAPAELGREQPAFREYDPEGEVVGSISNERTFHADVGDEATVRSMLCALCERVCWRARKRGVKARTVTLKLRYSDFHTISRSRTIAATSSEAAVIAAIRASYRRARTRRLPIRLLGVALSNLEVDDGQLSLFDQFERVGSAIDAVRERYGFDAVRLATGRAHR